MVYDIHKGVGWGVSYCALVVQWREQCRWRNKRMSDECKNSFGVNESLVKADPGNR